MQPRSANRERENADIAVGLEDDLAVEGHQVEIVRDGEM